MNRDRLLCKNLLRNRNLGISYIGFIKKLSGRHLF